MTAGGLRVLPEEVVGEVACSFLVRRDRPQHGPVQSAAGAKRFAMASTSLFAV
jgi:hypothetical protein